MSEDYKITDRVDDQAAAHEAAKVLDDVLCETGNPRMAMYLENGHLCGELVLKALRRAGLLSAEIDLHAYKVALGQVKEDLCARPEDGEVSGVWGSAAGYLTGDSTLLAARGHTPEEISEIQQRLEDDT